MKNCFKHLWIRTHDPAVYSAVPQTNSTLGAAIYLFIYLFTEINGNLVNEILYADDQILMVISVNVLQKMAHHLNLTARKYKRPYLI